jgi:Transposase, Mutator family
VNVGRDLISRVTDAVMDDVRAWAHRPLEDVYPVIFLDALVLKIREGATATCSGCGFRRRRARSSGCRSSQSSSSAACRTS